MKFSPEQGLLPIGYMYSITISVSVHRMYTLNLVTTAYGEISKSSSPSEESSPASIMSSTRLRALLGALPHRRRHARLRGGIMPRGGALRSGGSVIQLHGWPAAAARAGLPARLGPHGTTVPSGTGVARIFMWLLCAPPCAVRRPLHRIGGWP